MFTGLVEKTGVLKSRAARGAGATLDIAYSPWDEPCRLGDSVAVQGVCLTLTHAKPDVFCCDTLRETLDKTTLGRLPLGAPVNLERALRVGDRAGGHWVSGHVDGLGTVESLARAGEDHVLRISCDAGLLPMLAPKGSVALDGISLTVADVLSDSFTVHIVPHTWSVTALSEIRAGDQINLETDLLAKYVHRAVGSLLGRAPKRADTELTEEQIVGAGF